MEITQIIALRGPNRHSLSPVLEAILDTGIKGVGSRAVANKIARATLNYQQRAGVAVSFKSVEPGSYVGVFRLAIAYRNEPQARAALQLALQVAAGERVNLNEEITRLREMPPAASDHEAELARNSGKLIIAVTGTNGKTTVTRLIASILSAAGRVVGLTSTEGSWVGERQLDSGDNSGPQSARLVLRQPDVEVAVLETARGGILREGLAFDRADVAVVNNVSADHVGLRGVNTIEELARVKRVVVDAVKGGGTVVLNADNPYTVAMAEHIPSGARLIYFGLDKANPTLIAHLDAGGAAAYLDGSSLLLAHDGVREPFTDLAHLPISMNGLAAYQVANALAAAAATWAIGVPLHTIAIALKNFHTDVKHSSGRFNMFRLNDGLVILDYVHNQAQAQAIGPIIDALPATRRIVVPMSAGDRRDQDIVDYGTELGKHFDYFVLKDTRHRRGRRPGEMAGLIERGVRSVDYLRPHTVETIEDDDTANRHALSLVQAGDLLLIADDEFARVVGQIRDLGGAPLSERDFNLPSSPLVVPPAISQPTPADHAAAPATIKRGPGRPRKSQPEAVAPPAVKRGPGRPRKSQSEAATPPAVKRGPGRPRKSQSEAVTPPAVKRGPGRPSKTIAPTQEAAPAREMTISEVVALPAPNRYGNMPVLTARLDTGLSGQHGEQRAWDITKKTITYQQSAGVAVGFRSAMPTDQEGVYLIGIACSNEQQARAALQLALRMVRREQLDFASELKQLRDINPLAQAERGLQVLG